MIPCPQMTRYYHWYYDYWWYYVHSPFQCFPNPSNSKNDKPQEAVMTHLAEVGPLAVNVDASQWHSYTGEYFSEAIFGGEYFSRVTILRE